MAAAPDWSTLHQDFLTTIFLLLVCITDRVRFSTVCKHWRSVALRNPTPLLPWLLMPSTAVTSCYRILGGFSDPTPPLADHPRGARFCGSFPGGWFVVALDQISDHALLNLRSGQRVQLPNIVHYREFRVRDLLDPLTDKTRKCPIFIRAATMSAAPPADGGAGACVVAALTTGRTNIAFWRPGMDWWCTVYKRILKEDTMPWGDAEDLAFYHGWFYTVTPREELFRYKVSDHMDGSMKVENQKITQLQSESWQWQGPLASGEIVTRRYLLPSASGEDLLMVKRYVHPAQGTWRFQVFTLLQLAGRVACRRLYQMWGQVLFVGRGCSRAFHTGNRQRGCVYFLDDRRAPISVLQQDQYLCTDTGSFCCLAQEPDEIIRCLPREPATSDSSPSIWYFH